MEELGEPMGIKTVFQLTCSETSLGGEEGLHTPQFTGQQQTLQEQLEGAAPLPKQAAVFLPQTESQRGRRAGSTAGAQQEPSAMQ